MSGRLVDIVRQPVHRGSDLPALLSLLDVLTDNPGSIEVENAYLKPYRQWLKSVVEESPAPREPVSALEARSNKSNLTHLQGGWVARAEAGR